MSAARCGLSSAITGSFQDQWWRRSGGHELSIENAAISSGLDFIDVGVVAIR
jgi:hypothetical protein